MTAGSCKLLGGYFASFIQGCLAVLCIGTLVIKRQYEQPRRPWIVWFFDIMKQGTGSSFGHFSNIYLSMVISAKLAGSDECQWYCLTYITDSTMGTILNLCFLNVLERFVKCYPQQCSVLKFGEYGDPPQLAVWLPQLFVWLAIVIVVKIILLSVLLQLVVPLDHFLTSSFAPLRSKPKVELVLVMIVVPSILNTVQFWITDTFIKRQDHQYQNRTLIHDIELDEDLIEDHGSPSTSERFTSRSRSSSASVDSGAALFQSINQTFPIQSYSKSLFRHLGLHVVWRWVFGRTPRPTPTSSPAAVPSPGARKHRIDGSIDEGDIDMVYNPKHTKPITERLSSGSFDFGKARSGWLASNNNTYEHAPTNDVEEIDENE